EHQAAQAVAEQLLGVAQRHPDPAWLSAAHYALGQTLNDVGAFTRARAHLEQGMGLDDPQRHATPHTAPGGMPRYGVLCRARVPTVLWAAGLSGPGRAAESGGAEHGARAGKPSRLGHRALHESAPASLPPGVADGPGARRGDAGPSHRAWVCTLRGVAC